MSTTCRNDVVLIRVWQCVGPSSLRSSDGDFWRCRVRSSTPRSLQRAASTKPTSRRWRSRKAAIRATGRWLACVGGLASICANLRLRCDEMFASPSGRGQSALALRLRVFSGKSGVCAGGTSPHPPLRRGLSQRAMAVAQVRIDFPGTLPLIL